MVSNTSKFKDYTDRVNYVLNKINTDEVDNLLSCIKQVVNLHGKIYVLGNGGSAATASHFVNDLNVIAGRRGILIDSVSLTDNIASVTAISNDHSFNDIFSVQLTGRLKQSDLVFCISASGNSLNLINAVKYATSCNVVSVSLVGFDGGILRDISSFSCLVPSPKGEYGPTEDAHMSVCHYLALNC